MRLITRYLLKELTAPFLMGIVLFTFVLLFGKFLDLTDLVVNQGVGLINLIIFVLLGIPETFVLIVPMAMVLATLMAYGRLASDNEIMIFRIAGYPLYRLLIPTLVTGLLVSILLVGFTEYVAPALSTYRSQKLAEMKQPDPVSLMKPRTYQKFGQFMIYAEQVDGRDMSGVYIEDYSGEQTRVITSETGTWAKTDGLFELTLRSGSIEQAGENPNEYRILDFQTQTIQFQPQEATTVEESVASVTERWNQYRRAKQDFVELQQRHRNATNESPDPQALDHARKTYVMRGLEFHRALAFPFASFFLVLLAAPIGMLAQQEGKSMGFSVSLGIIFTYYMIMTLAEPLAMNDWIGPVTSMWSANVLFGFVGMGLFVWIVMKR